VIWSGGSGGEKKMSIEVAAEILGCITKEIASGRI